jgi:hypothetical protein
MTSRVLLRVIIILFAKKAYWYQRNWNCPLLILAVHSNEQPELIIVFRSTILGYLERDA